MKGWSTDVMCAACRSTREAKLRQRTPSEGESPTGCPVMGGHLRSVDSCIDLPVRGALAEYLRHCRCLGRVRLDPRPVDPMPGVARKPPLNEIIE